MAVYNIRIDTKLSMPEVVSAIAAHGALLSITVEGRKVRGRAYLPHQADVMHSPEAKAKASAARRELEQKKAREILDQLKEVLQANPHAPMNKIVDAMNASGVKNFKGTAWLEKPLQKWVDKALEELTAPASV